MSKFIDFLDSGWGCIFITTVLAFLVIISLTTIYRHDDSKRCLRMVSRDVSVSIEVQPGVTIHTEGSEEFCDWYKIKL